MTMIQTYVTKEGYCFQARNRAEAEQIARQQGGTGILVNPPADRAPTESSTSMPRLSATDIYSRRRTEAAGEHVDARPADGFSAGNVYADRRRQVEEITKRGIAAPSSRSDHAAKVGSLAYADSVYANRQGAVSAHIAAMREGDGE